MRELTAAESRAAIEQELRRWLDRDRASRQGAHPAQRDGWVRLRCLACNGMSSADASFCVHCGAKFNAAVVPA